MRVLCIAAHPDDEVLGVGGTLLRHKEAGDAVWVVLAHRCRTDSEVESREAERRMGIEYERLWETGRTIADTIGDYYPDIVYTHSLADLHHEHRALHESVVVACRPFSAPDLRGLYAFETPSATDWGMDTFRPVRFHDINQTIDGKLDAMSAYGSELRHPPHPRSLTSLRARAWYWGQVGGYESAEAFEVIRERW